ncbi:MAG: lipase family protein [Gammaproteobacteria bacterium]|nr:lipase family protein [Gammaproteobacteria bacterium]
MSTSTPLDTLTAAKLASSVYAIKNDTNAKRAIAANKSAYDYLNNRFNIDQASVVLGTSGIGPISNETGFALIVPVNDGSKKELAVVTRGTDSGYDWLSNIHATSTRGPGGFSVHTGFEKVFTSISNKIERDNNLKIHEYNHIHCVGHSLGGALANLFAAKFINEGHAVSLYTFGSPRVGMKGMSTYLENKLKTNIYRVYNQADPVPLVPIYPYIHTPASVDGMCVSNCGVLFSINAHSMKSYTAAVKDNTWKSLASASSSMPLHASVDHWLNKASEYVKFPGSSIAMMALSKALTFLLDLARATVGIITTIATSVPDLIAMLLTKAANLSKAIGDRLLRWISLVMKFVGKTIATTAKDITHAFLLWVLNLLIRPVLSVAKRAIQSGTRGFV